MSGKLLAALLVMAVAFAVEPVNFKIKGKVTCKEDRVAYASVNLILDDYLDHHVGLTRADEWGEFTVTAYNITPNAYPLFLETKTLCPVWPLFVECAVPYMRTHVEIDQTRPTQELEVEITDHARMTVRHCLF